LLSNKATISNKNIEKKRIFKSKNRDNGSDASGEEDAGMSDSVMMSENKSTFRNVARKSFIQAEATPKQSNKTKLPPSLSQKLYKELLKT
jgi:hypothetical protein